MQPIIDWGVAELTLPGQTESGDQYLIEQSRNGGVLIVAVDGLGHGVEAAVSAKRAINCIRRQSSYEALIPLVQGCHHALRGSRGVVMSLAYFNPDLHEMTWLGVGNVYGMLLRANPAITPREEFLVARGGVIGWQLPPLIATVLPIFPGDTMIFHTDGILRTNLKPERLNDPPQTIADHLLSEYKLETDDALVLVVRYKAEQPSR